MIFVAYPLVLVEEEYVALEINNLGVQNLLKR